MSSNKWPMVKLGEVYELQMGKTPSRDNINYWNDGSNQWISIADISRANKYINSTKETISDIAVKESNIKVVPKNTVIMSFKLSIGKTAITTQDIYTNEAIMAFIDKQKYRVSNNFAYYLFSHKKWSLNANKAVKGITLNKAILADIQVPLPPMDIQKKIAQVLDAASELTALYKKRLEELDTLIQSTFYEMFGDPVLNEKGWEIVKLPYVCSKITDGTHNSPKNESEGDFLYVTAKNIKLNGIDLSDISYVSKVDHEGIYSRCNPEYNDVLYIKDGATTGIAALNTLKEPFSMLSSLALLKINSNINSYYLVVLLNFPSFYVKVRNMMGGAAITRLTLTKIKEFPIPLPPLPLQQKFAEIVERIEEEKAINCKALEESEYLFKSLMSEYFD